MANILLELSPWQTSFRGSYATQADFPTGKLGDLAFAIDTGQLFSWTGTSWHQVGADLSAVVLRNGTQGLTADWNAGAHKISASAFDINAAGNLTIGGSVGANNLTLGGANTTVVIPGDLEVLGAAKKIETTDLEITDKNITLNKSGTDSSSIGAGLLVDRVGTKGSLIYDSTATSLWKIGALSAEIEVADISSSQSLTNKTLAVASNTISGSAYYTAVFSGTGALSGVATGTSGQFLKSAGDSALPAYASIGKSDISGGTAYYTAAYSSAGVLSEVATGNSGQFLKSAGASALPAYASITPADVGSGSAYYTAVYTSAGVLSGVATGTSGQFLKSAGDSALPAYASIGKSDVSGGTAYYTAAWSSGGTLTEIAPGSSGQFLKSAGASALPSYASIAQADVSGLTTASDVTFASLTATNGIVGRTSGTALGAGKVGEIISSQVNTSSTSNVGATGAFGYATSLSLTAGVWSVSGAFGIDANGAPLTDKVEGTITSSSSGVGAVASLTTTVTAITTGGLPCYPVTTQVFNVSGTTTVYLNTKMTYGSGSPKHFGSLLAVRIA